MLNSLHRELGDIRVVCQRLLTKATRFSQGFQMHAEGLDTGRIFHGGKLTPTAQPAGITYVSKVDYFLPCYSKLFSAFLTIYPSSTSYKSAKNSAKLIW